jgi:hypothetical protein
VPIDQFRSGALTQTQRRPHRSFAGQDLQSAADVPCLGEATVVLADAQAGSAGLEEVSRCQLIQVLARV